MPAPRGVAYGEKRAGSVRQEGRSGATDVPLLEADRLQKRFGGVHALRGVSLEVASGTIHALVGENGAGKSTFGKLVAGFYAPDGGRLLVRGELVRFRSPRDALAAGITIVGQERRLVGPRSVLDNVFLGLEPHRAYVLDRKTLRRRYRDLCAQTGFDLPAEVHVRALRVSEQLQVELLRALSRDARLLVLDEVTAALSAAESQHLFDVIRGLREQGRTILYISHFLEEVLALADTVSVLRDGVLVRTGSAGDESPDSLVRAMLGRSLALQFPARRPPPQEAPVVLAVRELERPPAVNGVSLEVRSGEIVALAGLIGSGRTELARLIFAADKPAAGELALDGRPLRLSSPKDAIAAGIALLPESRAEQGLLMRRSLAENVSIAHVDAVTSRGLLRRRSEREQVGALTRRLDVRTAGLRAAVESLSGGNQQKVLFAKWLFRTPRLLVADEPTHGVDVGAKHAIYKLICRLADDGLAVLLISSDLQEVLGLAHRILVMRGGRIVAEFDGAAADEEQVMQAIFGRTPGVAA